MIVEFSVVDTKDFILTSAIFNTKKAGVSRLFAIP